MLAASYTPVLITYGGVPVHVIIRKQLACVDVILKTEISQGGENDRIVIHTDVQCVTACN
jgi:hypothetical protein